MPTAITSHLKFLSEPRPPVVPALRPTRRIRSVELSLCEVLASIGADLTPADVEALAAKLGGAR